MNHKTFQFTNYECRLIHLDSIGCRASNIYAQVTADVALVFDGEFLGEFFYDFISAFLFRMACDLFETKLYQNAQIGQVPDRWQSNWIVAVILATLRSLR